VRGGIATWLLLLLASVSPTASEAVEAPAHRSLDVRLLGAASLGTRPVNPAVDTVTSGALDANFEPIPESKTRAQGGAYWLKIQPREDPVSPSAIPVIVIHAPRQTRVEVFADGAAVPLVTALAAFGGSQDRVYLVPAGIRSMHGSKRAVPRVPARALRPFPRQPWARRSRVARNARG
jgi:hypothetical protein